jgi:hypothetical protein
MTRGQSALEFLILAGFMFVATTMFLVVINGQSASFVFDAQQQEIIGVGDVLYEEILTAHRVHEGYQRTFTLPATINPYTVTLQDGREISIQTQENEYLFFLPTQVLVAHQNGVSSTGTLSSQTLTITKKGGQIILNVSPP